MLIRQEKPSDHAEIRLIVEQAFCQPAEANLIEQLRLDGDAELALVALKGNDIVGHVMFSKMVAPFRALGLGPVAVSEEWRRKGVASELIRQGLQKAELAAWRGVFVVGDPHFYRRFGFDPLLASGFVSPYAGPYLMALALGGPLPAIDGRIDYPAAFERLGC